MKRIFTLVIAFVASMAVGQIYGQNAEEENPNPDPIEGEEEDLTNWTRIGIGYYHPGLFDYFTNEWPDALEAVYYEDADDPGRMKVVPETYDFEGESEEENYLPPICPFVVYAYNHEKVYCDIISSGHRYVFDAYQFVREIVGIDGKDTNYGHIKDGQIWFDEPESFRIKWITGWVTTNLGGEFRLELPKGYLPGTGALTTIETESTGVTRYYNLQGQEVQNPLSGQVYIRANGTSRTKIVF